MPPHIFRVHSENKAKKRALIEVIGTWLKMCVKHMKTAHKPALWPKLSAPV